MGARIKAFLTHALVSTAIIGFIAVLVLFFWYPAPFYASEGAAGPLKILIMVDLILGPLLTLVVFKPGKRGLWLDMTLIFVMQLGALGYGVQALWSQRPVVLAFAVDSFYVVRASDLRGEVMPAWVKDERTRCGLPAVFAENSLSEDYALKVLFEGAADIHHLPSQYRPLQGWREAVLSRAYGLPESLEDYPKLAEGLEEVSADLVAAYPLYGREITGTVYVDRTSLEVIRCLDVDPVGLIRRGSEAKKTAP